MKRIVVDANVVLDWLLGDDRHLSSFERAIAEATLVAPWLWRIEVVNAILVQERQKKITQVQSALFFDMVAALNIDVVGERSNRGLEQLAAFARPHQLTAYDAVYLELAMTLNAPLYTRDKNLRAAAARLGVGTIG